MGRNRPSNEDAPRVPGEEGGRPWGKIFLGLLLLLALALLIPFACQALQGSGDPGSSGRQETAADGSGSNQNGAAGDDGNGNANGGTATPDGQQAAGGEETTAQDATSDAAGDGGEQAGGTEARIADIGRAGGQDGRVVTIPRAEVPGTEGWIAVHADDGGSRARSSASRP